LPWPVDDEARIAKQLYLAPLVRLVGRGDGALVAYVGRERGDVYRLRGGQLVPLGDETADVPGRHDQGGWSQARYERHIETGADRPAYVCPECGRAQATDGSCPLDGTTLQAADTGLDLAVHQTLTHGGTVEVIGEEHRDLEPVGGLAALLRF